MQLGDVAAPTMSDRQVLIRVHTFGINRADLDQKNGLYPPPPGASPLMGLEVAGVVEAVGSDVTRFSKGDRVMALVPGGGYAQLCVAEEDLTFQIPSHLTFREAATLPQALFTVCLNVMLTAGLKSGEWLLVHGASGGVGLTAIQIAKMKGAAVVATSSSDEKASVCLAYGADRSYVVNYSDFSQHLKKDLPSGVNVILDYRGKDSLKCNLALLHKGGRIVFIDAITGEDVNINLGDLIVNNWQWIGSVLKPRKLSEKTAVAGYIKKEILPLIESMNWKVIPRTVFAIGEIDRAHELIERSAHIGKVIVEWDPE